MKSKKHASVEENRCVACGECAYVCSKGAVTVVNGCFATVHKDSCVGCGICSRNCPAGCITIVERQVEKDEE